jgi:DNA-binding NarL/FixJ family response regulator
MTNTMLASRTVPDDEPRPRLSLVPRSGGEIGAVRVAIAVGRPAARTRLRDCLDRDGRISVVGAVGTTEEALGLALWMGRGVILIDSALPGLDAVHATRLILAESSVAVLLLTPSEIDEDVRAALRAGAGGVVADDAEPAELIRAVTATAAGVAVLSPRRLSDDGADHGPAAPREYRYPKVSPLRLASAHGELVGARGR